MIKISVFRLFAFSGLMRVLLVVYGYIQDATMTVKYTDIDYVVFTDAARFMVEGHSPYNRSTYRYSPVIASLLKLNILVHDSMGKLIFCVCDLIIAYLWYCMLKNELSFNNKYECVKRKDEFRKNVKYLDMNEVKFEKNNDKLEKIEIDYSKMEKNKNDINIKNNSNNDSSNNNNVNGTNNTILMGVSLWLLNPLSLTVSSRGNAESFILLFVSLLFFFLHLAHHSSTDYINNNNTKVINIVNANTSNLTTINLKIPENKMNTIKQENDNLNNKSNPKTYAYLILAALAFGISIHLKIYPITYTLIIYLNLNYKGKLKINDLSGFKKEGSGRDVKNSWLSLFWPSKFCFIFGLTSLITLTFLTFLFYTQYGFVFLQESYLHHITRKDHRHNFSPYFYLIYLSSIHPPSFFLSLITFLPQLLLSAVIAVKYHKDVQFACFVQTFIFVVFNKVCTSQYFLWFLVFLPCLVARVDISFRRSLFLFLLWLFGQALWLLFAVLLEMQGINTFMYIWLAGIVFLFINTHVISSICSRYCHKIYIYTNCRSDYELKGGLRKKTT